MTYQREMPFSNHLCGEGYMVSNAHPISFPVHVMNRITWRDALPAHRDGGQSESR
jgi:hypothetical protein